MIEEEAEGGAGDGDDEDEEEQQANQQTHDASYALPTVAVAVKGPVSSSSVMLMSN